MDADNVSQPIPSVYCIHDIFGGLHVSSSENESALVTLQGEDGQSYPCQLLDLFEFNDKSYALLLRSGEADDEGSLVIMQLVEKEGQTLFRTIESDEEFERVVAFLQAAVNMQTGQ
jgi:uncharacterized protein YrzB (UPF0473 family)